MNAHVKFSLAMAIFGSIGLFSVKAGLPSLELVFVRCLCASVMLGAVLLLTKRKGREERPPKSEYGKVLLCGLFLVLNWLFFFRSFEVMPITVAVSIYHLAPLLILLLGSLLFKEKLTWAGIASIVICFVGALLVGKAYSHGHVSDFLQTGIGWAFAAAFFYALTSLAGKSITVLSPTKTTLIQTMLGAVLLAPLVDWHLFSGLSAENWLFILITGFIHTGVVFYFFFSSLRELPASTIAILVFIDPIVAILLDVAVLHYRPDILQLVGILLIFLAMGYRPKKYEQKKA
ncbi:DMT family transporter [Bacillus sp. FSL W7-1321]